MNKNMTYFIAGGGTGGHIYPAVAVADFLTQEGNTIYYVGNPNNLEHDIVKDYVFLPVIVHGMPRKLDIKLLPWAFQMGIAVLRCLIYIKKYKPDRVFGTGGYVSAPALIAAKLLKVPFVMHDCDANPGLVTRKLAPYAAGVSLAFEGAKKFINNKNCRINGNPLREKFKTLTKEQARENLGIENKVTLCVMGGSQGAKTINNATIEILRRLGEELDIQVILQTGKKNFDDTIRKLSHIYPEYNENKNIMIRPYFEDMVTVLKASDIAVSRAGSLSISELCASGIATVFVPYPHAAADHQRKNAKYMEENGAGIYLEDDEITPQKLYAIIENLVNNPDKLRELQGNASKLAKINGTSDIVEQIINCV